MSFKLYALIFFSRNSRIWFFASISSMLWGLDSLGLTNDFSRVNWKFANVKKITNSVEEEASYLGNKQGDIFARK